MSNPSRGRKQWPWRLGVAIGSAGLAALALGLVVVQPRPVDEQAPPAAPLIPTPAAAGNPSAPGAPPAIATPTPAADGTATPARRPNARTRAS